MARAPGFFVLRESSLPAYMVPGILSKLHYNYCMYLLFEMSGKMNQLLHIKRPSGESSNGAQKVLHGPLLRQISAYIEWRMRVISMLAHGEKTHLSSLIK